VETFPIGNRNAWSRQFYCRNFLIAGKKMPNYWPTGVSFYVSHRKALSSRKEERRKKFSPQKNGYKSRGDFNRISAVNHSSIFSQSVDRKCLSRTNVKLIHHAVISEPRKRPRFFSMLLYIVTVHSGPAIKVALTKNTNCANDATIFQHLETFIMMSEILTALAPRCGSRRFWGATIFMEIGWLSANNWHRIMTWHRIA